ncbi:hypothetical protein BN1051_02668 [Arthrobacter saudimassiliensis]|uniref:Uncharacterized protein n=1 Tax=Arthrobacter saudimassiliensis TaxID=1461584 RepID=A0A078MSP0_9MICC|nr:hypothetical protein BN1051_02668 [Arthrobacter saudimassiliensis]
MHIVVPRGFEAYTRVFHPVQRDWPTGSGWDRQPPDWPDVRAPSYQQPTIEDESIRWSAVAEAMGTTMHPLAQFNRLIKPAIESPYGPLDAQGRRYSEPQQGNLAAEVLARVCLHLAAHTATPNGGVAAIWEGYGGLTSSAGYAQLEVSWSEKTDAEADVEVEADAGVEAEAEAGSRLDANPTADNPDSAWAWTSLEEAQRRGLGVGPQGTDPLAGNPPPGSGLLPADVVLAPTLDLPDRSYYLFAAGVRFFQDPAWVERVSWHHVPWFPQSPNMLWPADHAWVLVSEIDFDSTVVAGSRGLIAALVADPEIEALPLPEGADLSWDADELNRPDLS